MLLLLTGAAAYDTVHAQDSRGNLCTATLPVVDVADSDAMLLRMRQLQGQAPVTALTVRRPSTESMRPLCDADFPAPAGIDIGAVSAQLLPVRVRATNNSAYPVDINNGALWAGYGLSSALSLGATFRAGPLSAGIYPTVAHHQNGSYRTAPVSGTVHSPFTYGNRTIDWVQRFGPDPFTVVDPGQSYVRLDAYGAALGVSTENMWLGPAQRMPLMMGSSAAGFAHVFLGTSRPVDIRIGSLEVQAFWGELQESDYFDGPGDNDERQIAGLSAVFEPAFARGLFLGGNRIYLAQLDDADLVDVILGPYTDVRENAVYDDQMLSLFARWVLPDAGFEVYGEWAREDHWADFTDLLLEPDHSQVYMAGFMKTGTLGPAALRWFGEFAHLQAAMPLRAGRGVVTFYTHSRLTQGYTHRGQLLGAWIGPGSDAQVIGVERVEGRRTSMLMIERVRYDNDAFYNRWGLVYGQKGHDVSLGATLQHTEPFDRFSLRGALNFARRHNRNFIRFDGGHPGDFDYEHNVQLDVEARWMPGW